MTPNRNLTDFTDEQLLTELLWRGWSVGDTPKSLNGQAGLLGMDATKFRKTLYVDYGIELRRGMVTERILNVLLINYPNLVTHKDITDYVYEQRKDGGPLTANQSIETSLCEIRKRLKETPYKFDTVWGAGVRLRLQEEARV